MLRLPEIFETVYFEEDSWISGITDLSVKQGVGEHPGIIVSLVQLKEKFCASRLRDGPKKKILHKASLTTSFKLIAADVWFIKGKIRLTLIDQDTEKRGLGIWICWICAGRVSHPPRLITLHPPYQTFPQIQCLVNSSAVELILLTLPYHAQTL